MVGLTTATEAQKDAVEGMIEKMMNPERKPDKMSFTMGWDVVASYSEAQINKLLADRHAKEGSGLLQELNFFVEGYDRRHEETFTCQYRVKFGPPLLQFDPTATALPMCSIQMQIVSGTTQFDGGKIRNIAPGWSLKLNNIPLATVRGEISAAGTVQGKSQIIPGTEAVHFDHGQEQTQHVVLGFDIDRDKLTVSAIPPADLAMNKREHAAEQTAFQDHFKKYFAGKPQEASRSLSYSIASVNNEWNGKAVELTPEKFQFAVYWGGDATKDVRLISIFVQVAGGPKAGQTEALQERWKTQWYENHTTPIPKGFSASLILSSAIFNNVILKQGFEKSKWTVNDDSPPDKALNRIECRTLGKLKVIGLRLQTTNSNIPGDLLTYVEGFEINSSDFPMYLWVQQENLGATPNVYVYWKFGQTVKYNFTYRGNLSVVTRTLDGNVSLTYHLCDAVDHSKPRKLESIITVSDEAFDLDLKLKTSDFGMDDSGGPVDDLELWETTMQYMRDEAPTVSISAFGINFLRTTNLLMPGKNVIDINEGIGLRAPKDLVLVGDVKEI